MQTQGVVLVAAGSNRMTLAGDANSLACAQARSAELGRTRTRGFDRVDSPLSTANGSLEAHRTARKMQAGAITYLLASVVLLMERASASMATEAFAPLGAVMVMDLMLPEIGRQADRQTGSAAVHDQERRPYPCGCRGLQVLSWITGYDARVK